MIKNIYHKQTLLFALVFILLRALSLILLPHPDITNIILLILLPIFAYLCFTAPPVALLILLTELLLGGGGHFVELFGVSIRTSLLLTFLILTTARTIWTRSHEDYLNLPRPLTYGISLVLLIVTIATTQGVLNGHGIAAVQDAIPYLYLLLIPPAILLFRQSPFLTSAIARLVAVYSAGTALFTLFTFTLFSTGTALIHKGYYKWFRDVNIGKITDLGDNFFRIVESSHLILVPLILLLTALLMRAKQHWTLWIMQGLLLMTLSINLSRGYILALLIGLMMLAIQNRAMQWIKYSTYTVGILLISFITLHSIASGFTNMGLDELGLRSSSVANPTSEMSSATRMMLLPAILDQIKEAPLMGQGLGSSVTFYNTISEEVQTTRQYDWGYLELIAEFGIVGALVILGSLLALGALLIRSIQSSRNVQASALLSVLVALLVMHLTAPSLTHVFGIVIVCAILISSYSTSRLISKSP